MPSGVQAELVEQESAVHARRRHQPCTCAVLLEREILRWS
jgi:hypothetical protein